MVETLSASFLGPENQTTRQQKKAIREIISEAGSLPPSKLSAAHVMEIDSRLRRAAYAPTTKWNYAKAIRQILRWLWEHHGAPKLDAQIKKYPMPRPRNVTVSDNERATLLAAAPPHLRLWILLCSDLAIRSGTAAILGPTHYNHQRGTLTFTTKCDEHLSLPVTQAVEELIRTCDLEDPMSFVRQLWVRHRLTRRQGKPFVNMELSSLRQQFANLRRKLDMPRRVTLHDHRRTAAVAMLEETRDVREVQALLGHKNLASTFWYLELFPQWCRLILAIVCGE